MVTCWVKAVPLSLKLMLLFSVMVVTDEHLFGKELFILFIMRVFSDPLSVCVCLPFFPFGFEAVMWDLIALVLDHCLCNYFVFLFLLVPF